MVLVFQHLPGAQNVIADEESRKFDDDKEWMIVKPIFDVIVEHFGQFSIDLFASRLNAQLSRYVSWRPDPDSEYIDAFSRSWKNINFYAFPPFSVIVKCLQKIVVDKAEGILVVPLWTGQTWFPKILSLLCQNPLVLPLDVLIQPRSRERHHLSNNLRLKYPRLTEPPIRHNSLNISS